MIPGPEEVDDIEAFVRENTEDILRVLRHSNMETARAYAWALLDYVYDSPELSQLHDELDRIDEESGVSA